MRKNVALTHLNGLTPAKFLRDYWQKKPLLIRNAFPDFEAPLTQAEIIELAGREEAESRLITKPEGSKGKWKMHQGPISKKLFGTVKKLAWTVLVQDTQHFSREAHQLLQQFSFIPHARIDDLMVSYAVKGGGVGPHFDSYDVFLLQGTGERRWQISAQRDLSVAPDVTLKLLANFKPEQEWVLKTGDMLYLPPGYAHHGVAETDCVTWSIGFRAPGAAEISYDFLDFLRDELAPVGVYKDRDLSATEAPGSIDRNMQARLTQILAQVTQAASQTVMIKRFAGRFFSEPKSHVFFDAPDRKISTRTFLQKIKTNGVELDLKTKFLFVDNMFFINGDELQISTDVPNKDRLMWRALANTRVLAARDVAQLSLLSHMLLQNLVANGYVQIL